MQGVKFCPHFDDIYVDMANIGVFNRAIQLNPYPVKWRLPGHNTDVGTTIDGVARRGIVHALTFHEIPRGIDKLIDKKLPKEKELQALTQLQKDYLSFTVYSIKQMVAVGTISAETAWTLFNAEWGRAQQVEDSNFAGMRQGFWQGTYNSLSREFGDMDEADLLRFEFLARAGKAGLAQYERYKEWTFNMVDGGVLREEYRKGVWLEKKMLEEKLGLSGLTKDIEAFELNREAGSFKYNQDGWSVVEGSVDLFGKETSAQSGDAIDSCLKAEVGHWIFGFHRFNSRWFEELVDRMNMSAYTERVTKVLASCPEELYPPEVQAFISGGYFLSSGKTSGSKKEWGFPVYPQRFPIKGQLFSEKHKIAEYLEQHIRQRILLLSEGQSWDLNRIYCLVYKQVALLELQGKTTMEILGEIALFDPRKVSELEVDSQIKAYKLFMDKKWDDILAFGRAAVPVLAEIAFKNNGLDDLLAINMLDKIAGADSKDIMVRALSHKDFTIRSFAAELLIKYDSLSPGQDRYNKLNVYRSIGKLGVKTKGAWPSVVKLGHTAIPALEAALKDSRKDIRGRAAEALIAIKGLREEDPEYDVLHAYKLLTDRDDFGPVDLGENPYPALLAALEDESGLFISHAIKAAKRIKAENIIRKALSHKDLFVRQVAAQAAIDIGDYDEGSQGYQELYAYTLDPIMKTEELTALGNHAIPALFAVINENDGANGFIASLTLREILGEEREFC